MHFSQSKLHCWRKQRVHHLLQGNIIQFLVCEYCLLQRHQHKRRLHHVGPQHRGQPDQCLSSNLDIRNTL